MTVLAVFLGLLTGLAIVFVLPGVLCAWARVFRWWWRSWEDE